jgi:hypothetical protein
MNIPFDCASISEIKDINSSFASGTLKVMYLGKNRNESNFSKAAVENALPSLYNVPIVCHWDEEAGTIGGHDMTIVKDSDGGFRFKNLTEPCGVVPEHAKFYFQTECDENGAEHEYLIIKDVIIWKRQDVYKHIVEDLDGVVKHSMEITVLDSSTTQDGYLDITKFEFTALCLLENCEPCFQGSELELYSVNGFKQKMEQMMHELKECFNMVGTSKEVDNIHPQKFSTGGGNGILEKKMELVAQYNINLEALDFSIEDFTEEELREKFEAIKNADANKEPVQAEEGKNETGDGKKQEDFALTSTVIDELIRELNEVTIEREWGECERYWYSDCDFELGQVYCWDTVDWLLYGFEYTVDGDSVNIDFESKKRKKYTIVDFDEGTQDSPFSEMFTKLEQKLHDSAEWEARYNAASSKINDMETELDTLRKFKNDVETENMKVEREAVFTKFNNLDGVEAFEALRTDMLKYDVETLEDKCYAILGRMNSSVKFSLETKSPKLPVGKSEADEPYGGIFTKYGIAN